jgi:hypothetical protein
MRRAPLWVKTSALCVGMLLLGLGLWRTARGLGEGAATDADWLAAIATLAAFLAAMVAGWFAARAYEIELRRERDRISDTRRAQASLVVVWYDVRLDPMRSVRPEPKPPTPWSMFGVWIRNASELPVFDASIQVEVDGTVLGQTSISGEGTGRVGVVPPTREPVFRGLGEEITAKLEALRPLSQGSPIADPPVPNITLRFTDAAGLLWVRKPSGRLVGGVDAAPLGRTS